MVLLVTDADGDTAADTAQITINNVVPTVDAGGPYTVAEGGSVQVTGSCSGSGCSSREWDVDGQPGFEVSGDVATFSAVALDGPSTRTVTFRGCDADGDCATSSSTVTINNAAPSINAIRNDGPIFEGSSVIITVVAIDPAGELDPPNYEYDCNNDLTYDIGPQAGSSASCGFSDEGSFVVNVRVTDGDGGEATASTTVTVLNADPVVTALGDTIDEGQTATVSADFTDEGTLDIHDASVDWGDNTAPQAVAVAQGSGFGSLSASHVYSDNGDYSVVVTVTDDDTGVGTSTVTVTVNNLAPSIILNVDEAVAFGPEQVFLGRKDDPQTHSVDASDPGSDDLTFNWDFEVSPATNVHFNNGATPEPADTPSPHGIFPFSATDSASVTYTTPGIYSVTVEALDDDGGQSGTQSLTKIVTDNCDCTEGKGFWKKQSKERRDKDQKKVDKGQLVSEDILAEYLNIVNFGSSVFTNNVVEDGVPLTTLAETHLILSGNAGGPAAPQTPQSVTQDISTEGNKKKKKDKGSGTGDKDQSAQNNKKKDKDNSDENKGSNKKSDESKESKAGSKSATGTTKIKGQALSQLLAAWLNYAKGAIELDEEIVIDGGETGSGTSSNSTPSVTMTFQEIIAEVESILNNPDATKADLERAKSLAESVNLHDKNNPDCETGSGRDKGSETG